MLIYFGMNLTMREELTILSLCFIFSALTIPIVIVTSNEYRQAKLNADNKVDLTPMKIQPIFTYRDKALINSVQIIEGFNQNRTNGTDELTFSKLLNMKPYELREKYLAALKTMRMTQKNIDNSSDIWRRFAFQNGTLLTSKSFKTTAIPLSVDW